MYRVREEIDEVVGDKTSVEADDLDKLTYMNQVCICAHYCDCKYQEPLMIRSINTMLNSASEPTLQQSMAHKVV